MEDLVLRELPPLPDSTIRPARKDIALGRLALPTAVGALSEVLGGALETVGGAVTPGEQRPRTLGLSLALRGDRRAGATVAYDEALRLRRQVRGLLSNDRLRLHSLFLEVGFDDDISSWLILGGGTLDPGEGGITIGDWDVALADVYVVASPRSHREARYAEFYDRRQPTTPRDYRHAAGVAYGDDFATQPAQAIVALPAGAGDPVGIVGPVAPYGRVGRGGTSVLVKPAAFGDVVSFERTIRYRPPDDVVLWDARGRDDVANSFVASVLALQPKTFHPLGDDETATTLQDYAPDPRPATTVGSPVRSQIGGLPGDPSAHALAVDQEDYARVGHDPGLRYADVSVCANYAPHPAAAGIEAIASKADDETPGWRFGFDHEATELVLEVSNGTLVATARSGAIGLRPGVYQMVGASFDSTTGIARFYRGGEERATVTNLPTGGLRSNTLPITFGRWAAL